MSMSETEELLISPYGGRLVDLLTPVEELEEARARAANLPRIQLSQRSVCDLELLATGAFSPLDRFMSRADYQRVLAEIRLASGHLFSLPITLTFKRDARISLDKQIALADQHNNLLATMWVDEIYEWDEKEEGLLAYGTTDPR